MSKNKKIKVGITGSIGSGKSVFCSMLREKGFLVIDVDELSKQILVSDNGIKSRIIKEFGKEAYTGGKLNKKFLAEKVFSDLSNVLLINSIVHPAVKVELVKKMDEILKDKNIVFAEAALIYEADMENMFDYIVLVTADYGLRMKRKSTSVGFTEEEFADRNRNQIPDSEKKKRADFIFENNGGLEELKIKTDLLIKILEGL